MRITASVDTSALQATLADGQSALAGDLRRGMEAAAAAVQADLRSRTQAAGLGPRLAKAWGTRMYPPRAGGKSLNPAAVVYSKSEVLFSVFTEGATIIPRKGRFLAIPTPEAEALGFATTNVRRDGAGSGNIPRRLSMVQNAIRRLGAKNIRTVPAKRGRMLMLYRPPTTGPGQGRRTRGADVPLFILVPQVRLHARLDINAARAQANAILAAEFGTALA